MAENIEVEDEQLDLDRERAQSTLDPTEDFVIRLEVQAIMTTRIEKSASHHDAPVLAELAKDKLIDALQFFNYAVKTCGKDPFA